MNRAQRLQRTIRLVVWTPVTVVAFAWAGTLLLQSLS